jgi:hypothetical protein
MRSRRDEEGLRGFIGPSHRYNSRESKTRPSLSNIGQRCRQKTVRNMPSVPTKLTPTEAVEFRAATLASSSLADVFENEEAMNAFRTFLSERQDYQPLLDSISFVEAVERYRNLRDHAKMLELAQDIMRFFVLDIKLEQSTLQRLMDRSERNLIALNMFDDAAEEVRMTYKLGFSNRLIIVDTGFE